MIRSGRSRWLLARSFIEKMSTGYWKRIETEFATANALCRAYLEESRKPKGERLPQERLAKLAADAQGILESGIQRMQNTGWNRYETMAEAVLALVQVRLAAGAPDKAEAMRKALAESAEKRQ